VKRVASKIATPTVVVNAFAVCGFGAGLASWENFETTWSESMDFRSGLGTGFWFDAQTYQIYDAGDLGPDGKTLNLLKECEVIKADTKLISESDGRVGNLSLRIVLYAWTEIVNHPANPPFAYAYDMMNVWQYYIMTDTYENVHYETNTDYYYYLVPIGPLLFLIEASIIKHTETYSQEVGNPVVEEYARNIASAVIKIYSPVPVDYPENIAYCEAIAAEGNTDTTIIIRTIHDNTEVKHCSLSGLAAVALYTDELYQAAKDAGSLDNFPAGFSGVTFWMDSLYSTVHSKTDIDFSIFVRPHTKEELQAAGMWP